MFEDGAAFSLNHFSSFGTSVRGSMKALLPRFLCESADRNNDLYICDNVTEIIFVVFQL